MNASTNFKIKSALAAMMPRALRCLAAGMALSVAAGAAVAGDRKTIHHDGPIQPDLIFHNYCSVCHGDRGDGRSHASDSFVPPPRDFTAPAAMEELSRDRMILSVTYGRPGTAMAGWRVQLNPKEIAAVVDYIRDTIMIPHDQARKGPGHGIYAADCLSCHGVNGDGLVHAPDGTLYRAAPDLTTPEATEKWSRDRMLDSVTNGMSGTYMVDFGSKLSKDQIASVVDYIRAIYMLPRIKEYSGISAYGATQHQPVNAPSPAAEKKVDMSLPLPDGLAGEAQDGRAYYTTNCIACHGEKGDGKGPRAYFINPRPRDFLESASRARLNRPALFEAISNGRQGTEMPAWGKVLDAKQIADLAEYVFETFISAPPLTAANNAVAK